MMLWHYIFFFDTIKQDITKNDLVELLEKEIRI